MLLTCPLLIVLLPLLLRHSLSTTIQCYEPQSQRLAAPPHEDCLTSIAHMPSLAPDLAASDQPLSMSHPFHPQAGFLHRRCKIITFVHYEETEHTPIGLNVDPIPINETVQPRGYGVLNEANVFQAWNSIKQLAQQVVEQCVEMRRVDGIGEEVVTASEGWSVRYRIYVSAVWHDGVWADYENHPLRAGRRALGQEEANSFMMWNDMFAQTYNVI